MKYQKMTGEAQEALWRELEAMSVFLAERFAALSQDEAIERGPDGILSPVEQCWHLADLEREGFGARISRLLTEREPQLPDFDGARVAAERQYKNLSLGDGLRAFDRARALNLARLRSLQPEQWFLAGMQEGVGAVALCDLPHMMAQHDAAHRGEIMAWSAHR